MVANKERIYVGGLDPSRGLTVELVASRLCSVDGVEILSINDVATKSTNADNTNSNASSLSTIYTKKQSIIDEDGDLVDTRNFFFLEARSTTNTATHAAAVGDDNEKKSNTNHNTQSALDILSKQYNSVKWKGCQLRVEYAKPHFLQRLQDERQEKKQATIKSAQDVINNIANQQQQDTKEDEKTVIKCRRRLRIRKRFGEEAYHVDTQPHSIDSSSSNQYHQQTPTTSTTNSEVANNNNNNGGWDSFAFLHKRLKNKRKSQQLKLIERRKKERRLWASNNKNEQENVDELNSLIFLNRGIHIRFNDEVVSSSLSSSMDTNRIDSSREVISAEETAAMKSTKEVEDNVEAYTSSSSSAVSSDSEESTSVANREKKVYNWSDDSEEEEEGMNNESNSSRSGDSSTDREEEDKSTKKYVWSDDEDDESISDSTNNKGTKKMIDGSAYTAAAAVDEFSGGMDFDIESNSDDDGDASYNSGDDDDDDDDSAAGGEELHVCLEDDITSNMGILSKMFPNDSFEKQPLAASIANDGEENDNVTTNGGVVKQQQSSLYGGAGLIMQRYDPTKESDKRFEVPQVKQDDNDDVEKQPSSQQQQQEVKEKDDILSDDTNDELPTSTIDKEEGEENSTLKEKIELTKKEEKATTNVAEKIVPAKDIYEQDKLDDIFKQSREGKSSFSLANMFQTDDKNVYEQDKLESVFKEARTDSSGGFSFGFQSELPQDTITADDDKGGFSFGFDTGNITSTGNKGPEEKNTTTDTSLQALLPTAMEEEAVVQDQPKAKSSTKKRRKGMRFLESDLDKYEDMFFSLNEGPEILKDLDGMKQNEANQEQWQKERLILTADWKRKVKTKKPKKIVNVKA